MIPATRNWDGESYQRVGGPIMDLGRRVLATLDLRGDETLLDAGCGSGQLTAELVRRLPRGRVIAVDASPSMVAVARRRLGPSADVRLANLVELELQEQVEVVVSTAVFHWIGDHARLFERLHAALRPGGRLLAQCGGEGNVEHVHAAARLAAAEPPYAASLAGWTGPWNFSSAERARVLLEQAGFREARAWLQDAPLQPDQPTEYLRTVILGAHLDRLPATLHDGFVVDVEGRLPRPLTIDYVRLNLDAVA
jgi:trans-aconitate 2-methyltransferase